jgi:hypothetical protein
MSAEGESSRELFEIARAAEQLARDEDAFKAAAAAYAKDDASAFEAALAKVGVQDDCRWVCYFFCEKACGRICTSFCPERPGRVSVAEMREFALALGQLVKDARAVKRLEAIMEKEDAAAWQAELKKRQLERFCHQLCRFFCRHHCRHRCRRLCPPRPEITRVSSIPVSQFTAAGFGNGPSIPPFQVPLPNPPGGVGDHPIGGSSWLMGQFHMPTATEYKIEVAAAPAGPYGPIAEPVYGYNGFPPPWPWPTRVPSGGADPGWYAIADLFDSDGGADAIGEKTLVFWTTPPSGIYYLRLRARDGVTERVGAPLKVVVDNTGPPTPVIGLELLNDDGSREKLVCGKVKKGALIVVTVEAHDENFSSLSVAAQGNSSLSVPVVGVPLALWPGGAAVPLSKTYNGNLADTGYPVPTSFVWNPYADPLIQEHPCCYVVRIDIWDRTVINNAWAGGHGNSGWEAIEIAL